MIKTGIYSFYIVILFDFITKILLTYSIDTFNRFSFIPKFIIIVFLLLITLKLGERKKINLLILYLGMFILTLIAFFSLYRDYNYIIVFKHLYNLSLYSYPFILVTFFRVLNKQEKKIIIQAIEKPIYIIGVISSILIILGLITKIELFRAYSFSNRFGYNGIFLKTSEASYYYICLLILSTYYFFIEKKKKIVSLLFLTTSLLIGTKIVWLCIALLIFFYLFEKNKKITTTTILILVLVYFLFRKTIDNFLIVLLPNGEKLYKENGMFTVLTSTRDLLLEQTIIFSNENWNFINYLFGGNKYGLYKVEFEFLDLFFLFGFLGIVIFYFFLKNNFFKKIKGKFSCYLLIVVLTCAFFAGNFFKSFLVFSVFYFVFQNLIYKEEVLLENNEAY
ncbi:hypothetical protein [Lacinutrix venerupis]|uniref:hypothetical protein n=1 Tax=Lacinutrix venerupis TaxID=1486034 RepID=UPI0011C41E1D|nr:hypothetical protein [Lacinutrix venerupis]